MGVQSVAFYVAAHQDDWQFFRGEQAYVDLNIPGARIVFIYTTAGDNGWANGWWEAREKGAIASIRSAIPPSPLTIDVRTIADHPIRVFECGRTISYCLRLPDGVGDRSLSGLRAGIIPSLTALDHSTTYHGWDDFRDTLRGIMEIESSFGRPGHPWVNAPDYHRVRNPNDHLDHQATADALWSFVAGTYRRAWWVSYDIMNRPPNLDGAAIARKRRLFDAYATTVREETTANGEPIHPNETEWGWWGNRSYVTLREAYEADD
jgi:hypothetical protein